MGWTLRAYDDADALATGVADALAAACDAALAERGHAWLALAGGRTPFPSYRALAARPLRWADVTVVPTDERCVPHEHEASNLRGLREAFAAAAGVRIESLTTVDGEPGASEAHAQSLLARAPARFDAALLGMGNDAHTASLFPGARQLRAALDPRGAARACRVDPDPLPPEAPFPRISLTVAALLAARAVHLVITGDGKRAVLEQASAAGDPLRHPIAAILLAPDLDVQVHWCA
jgi:6-phosphogluconolactonase